jgi:TRAP-type C4-dicarboxylate transport system substrate-binding protein
VLVSRIAWGRLKPEDRKLLTEATREAGTYQRGLSQEIDAKLLVDFRANPAVAVNAVDQAPFRAATAAVAERWEAKPFGDFVKRLRAAAA